MAFCNPKEEFSALLCQIPSEWRDQIVEALDCALSQVLSGNADAVANPSCDKIKECESVTSLITNIQDNILTATYVNEQNITTVRNTDLTEAINNALDNVDPKCLMTQEEWDILTYEERLDSIFAKVCCTHGNCGGNNGTGNGGNCGDGTGNCGCEDCGDNNDDQTGSNDCIGLDFCRCMQYRISGNAPYGFTYRDCDTKEIVEYVAETNDVIICAMRCSLNLSEDLSYELLGECGYVPPILPTSSTTTTTSTTSTTSSTSTTTSTSTTSTTTLFPPTTTTTTSTTTTTTLFPIPTTTTTTTSTTTSTTTVIGVAVPTAIYSNGLGTHCSQPINMIYTDDGTIFSGRIAYIDIYLTNPLTGYSFISDSNLSAVYYINNATGLIGANTGMFC